VGSAGVVWREAIIEPKERLKGISRKSLTKTSNEVVALRFGSGIAFTTIAISRKP
jgi:hypothetical protein